MDFRSPLVWPDALPKADDYPALRKLFVFTHGRIACDMEYAEKRARRLLYYYGSPPGQLQGSQHKHEQSPYYTELFAHEMGHALHADLTLKEIRWGRLSDMIDLFTEKHTEWECNQNELQASASATLVLEYLGMPYDLYHLIISTARNLRGKMYVASEAYEMLLPLREDKKVQEVARQTAHLIVKIKNGPREATEAVLPSAS